MPEHGRPTREVADASGASAWATAVLITPGVAAAASFAMLPVILGAVARGWRLSDAQVGLAASIELGGLTLGTLGGVVLMRRWGRRRASNASMILLALANLLTMAAPGVGPLMGLRAVAGLAAGGGLAVCYANLSGAPRAERNFAIFTLAQLLLGAAGLVSLPYLAETFGWSAPYGLLAAVAACGLVAAWIAPPPETGPAVAQPGRSGGRSGVTRRGRAALVGVGLYFAGVALVWAYAERIGVAMGMETAKIAATLAGSQIVAMTGAVCAGLLAGRAPVPLGLAAGTALTAVGVVALVFVRGPAGYMLAVSVVTFAWNYVTAPQFAAIAAIDVDGSASGLMSTVTGIGVATGPALGAVLAGHGFAPVLMLGAALVLGSLALIWPAVGRPTEVPEKATLGAQPKREAQT